MQSCASETKTEQNITCNQSIKKNWENELQTAVEEGMKNKMNKITETVEGDTDRIDRIENRVKQLNEKLESIACKYLNNDSNSIRTSIIEHARLGHDKVYINLQRDDFVGWHTFVKGGYKNAHPKKCVHLLFRYAQQHGYLPNSISWEVWNNQSFTVVFTIHS